MKKRLTLRNVVILVLLCIFSVSFIRQEIAMRHLKIEIQEKSGELDKLKEKNERLKDEVQGTKTDDYSEKMARERLGSIKPGEKAVISSEKK
ncbi:Cell division protein FtsB [Clostridium cavendishii DSM 21758]|uniref:Cell division protein FtsB n=1 Tax=Clostridium cavendishii DSM 21758 TaxID=1121302 RepID=A0A1M6P8C8_9CLOT|nr:septum formation initiator family protein [Clostridium cavendishii]SHK04174.1 Cell division protein FtsB [Clostridium cavendishii DSM 21758]